MDSNCAIAGRRRAESLITGDVFFCYCAEMRGEGDMSVNKHVEYIPTQTCHLYPYKHMHRIAVEFYSVCRKITEWEAALKTQLTT